MKEEICKHLHMLLSTQKTNSWVI